MRQQRQRVLVSGAAGFIGSPLCDHLTGARSALEVAPMPEDDARRRRPNITLARELHGWQPRINSDEGLAATVAYFNRLQAGELR